MARFKNRAFFLNSFTIKEKRLLYIGDKSLLTILKGILGKIKL